MSNGSQHQQQQNQDPQEGRAESPAAAAPMSREAAEAILSRHGLDAAGLAPAELRRRWQELARRHHPDLGGDGRAMQEINAAYAFLKPRALSAASSYFEGARDVASPRVRGFPAWVWAGHGDAGTVPDELILRQDYTDRNFLKKRLWELSEGSTEEWTLWAFDGRELLPPVVAYGSDAVFAEMAKAMLQHGRRGFRAPRAVLAQAPDTRYEVLVLHSDGLLHEPPAALPVSSPEGPARDRAFLFGLPERLDALAGGRGGPVRRRF